MGKDTALQRLKQEIPLKNPGYFFVSAALPPKS